MKWFRVARDVYGGPPAAYKYVEQEPFYNPTYQDSINQCHKKVAEEFYAVLYLKNANQKNYGSILQGLNTQQTLHNDQYPKTIIDANNVLSNHKFDNYKSMQPQQSEKDWEPSKRKNKDDKDNKEEQEISMSFAQLEGVCYCCGKKGHKSPNCWDKDKIP